ncbi:IS110 family RNA-guided transposase [Paraburkholderia sp. RL17-337-BIB-A]|uniref:IS110 family transposase n=1 Tax=Paraburkholderia sp. RL17-337-BIB-A TaxID=3031636 RepID=UPI0038BE0281
MAQPKLRRTVGRRTDMSVVNPHAAGIDVGAQFHVVAVGPECVEEPVRSFRSFTADLHELARWLRQVKVTTVVMESTGSYWLPVFEILESYGFEVLLVNAREAKSVPGRKSDVNDAQWLQKLHRYGLLRASFRPRQDVATLRSYLRQRERLLEYAASHIQHMQKAMMQMNVQLHHVVQDITGVTGMKIIRAIVAASAIPMSSHSIATDVARPPSSPNTCSSSPRPWPCTTSTRPR